MADGGPGAADRVAPVVREILAVTPAGCSWLQPVRDGGGRVVDFRVEAVSGQVSDIHGRGVERVGALVGELYPTLIGGPLWQAYHDVLATGTPRRLPAYRYRESSAGVVAESTFEVSVHRVLGGVLACWERLDEEQRRLERTEHLGRLGWSEYDLTTGRIDWSPGMYRIFERDPALGPMSRTELTAAVIPDDRALPETAWQTLDSGATSDVTVRFRAGAGVKYLRVISDVARDADGVSLKIYSVVQDVTAREDSRTAIQRLRDLLHTRETTALAEHRLAGQLQNMIQPVPREPFPLAGLQATVSYVPAERAVQVGGDWYHAQTLPDGHVALGVGDVAGHGLEAASGMAHLRFALVAWLSIGIRDPGVLLGHMNRLSAQLCLTGTAVVALFDPAARTLCWARAGHMPPLLTRAGAADGLDPPPGLLLGADDDAGYPVAVDRLQPDDLLLFYTDGLVERRSANVAERLDAVRRDLVDVWAEPGEPALARLRDLLHRPSPDDDTCTLAVRVLPD
ncbi:SpoIIE family protein phosphatase [Dactylosporangium roseum]|uniref:SpoIIE family protein phosphatase n=1 Tax=Dactylosporangium roseum TaxID=47989 RepID=A0ABY5YUU3_9ACTN|nr:SpoIIE family protein phosphatase [Dactylosporangium roseum]UWZ33500.1 SpoIIE family protein phosphatase [Dactylosporangium roseum]